MVPARVPDDPWSPPQEFDSFSIVEPLGRGGMGHVYLGREEHLDRLVALKFISAANPSDAILTRFRTEARAIARLAHPNVVGVFRIGEVAGRPYIAYEFVPGQSLDRIPRPLKWTAVLRIATQVARGLEAAHRAGILHRDIKPANVVLSDSGQIKLLDFGLAKVGPGQLEDPIDTGDATRDQTGTRRGRQDGLTRPGTIMGTPAYLAPEQWCGDGASMRTDVFSLGVVLYELLTGELPHDGAETVELAEKVVDVDMPPVRSRAPDVPESFAQIVDRCVKRNPLERYASGEDVRQALEEIEAVFVPASAAIDTISLQGEVLAAAASLARITSRMDSFTEMLYAKLFERAPALRELFPDDLRPLREKLWHALRLSVDGLREPERLAPVLRDLGRRHVGFGAKPDDYDALGEALLATLATFDASMWNEELARAWRRAYAFVAGAMRRGAGDVQLTRESSTKNPISAQPPEISPKTRYAKNGKASLAYQLLGAGSLDIVILPGWLTNIEVIARHPLASGFASRLARLGRVILMDKRGSGLSERSLDGVTLETRLDDLAAVLAAAKSSKAVIFGMGEGASIGAAFAARHPEKVTALVAYAASSRGMFLPDATTMLPASAVVLAEIEEHWGEPVFLKRSAPSMVNDAEFGEWFGAMLRMASSPGAAIELWKQAANLDVRNILPNVSAPSLVLHRTGDRSVPIVCGRDFAGRIPNAKFVELAGEDHLAFVGDSNAIHAEIEAFLGAVR